MPTSVDLRSLISSQAQTMGVPPSIALAVAQQESGISQWRQNGTLVTGSSGEIGVFQLMPATAAGLGVDPSDLGQNIAGGISYLAQLFQKYGDWSKALSAYNSGSPTGSPSYASSVLAMAGSVAPSAPLPDLSIVDGDDGGVTLGGIPLPYVAGATLGAIALVLWALD